MKHFILIFITLFFRPLVADGQNLSQLADSVKKGFRGLSVVSENVIWMSGQKGLVGNSYNGGRKWKWNRVKGFEQSDIRSIFAFDKKTAVIANAGFPASVLRTSDGGKNWTTVFQSKDSVMFFDGIDFWDNNHGIIFGDPVNGRMYLSETFDGGKSWKEIPFEDRPQLKNGEAGFAASGTSIRVLPGGHVYIGTGGTCARLWHSRDYGHHWEVFETPMLQGKPSQGIFSLAFYDTLHGIIVGGDYLCDSCPTKNCFLTNDGGETWKAPGGPPNGYRSCVSLGVPYKNYDLKELNMHDISWPVFYVLSTGTNGTDLSRCGGGDWSHYDFEYFDFTNCTLISANTIRSTVDGRIIYLCGGNLGFARLDIRKKQKSDRIMNLRKRRLL